MVHTRLRSGCGHVSGHGCDARPVGSSSGTLPKAAGHVTCPGRPVERGVMCDVQLGWLQRAPDQKRDLLRVWRRKEQKTLLRAPQSQRGQQTASCESKQQEEQQTTRRTASNMLLQQTTSAAEAPFATANNKMNNNNNNKNNN
ncbi:unnamed protein product [Polarella glacialis]|uniref:Uncharacterized protein n=1 Tax=Polarella glacialis TaxID=89957 RepID=A0A813E3M2_POLGL|nr:unnamed protein product [Polarella glacialis]